MQPDNNVFALARVIDIWEELPGIKTFILQFNRQVHYQAGQFITLLYREQRRSYSLISAPSLDERLAITVKRIDNGLFSRYLHDRVVVGDELEVASVSGMFCLPEDPVVQIFFFAAGIGITPIYAMLKELLHTTTTHAVLVYSNHSRTGSLFLGELLDLQMRFPHRFQIHLFFSDNTRLAEARVNRDTVKNMVATYAIGKPERILAYTCGPFSYMRMVGWALEEAGLLPGQIRRENFDPQLQKPPVSLPPDTGQHALTIVSGSVGTTITTAYPETLLDALLQQGYHVPFSCRTGRCGSCALKCKAGKVWMSVNEVLTPKQLESGWVLTCTGYAIDGDIILEV